MKIKITVPMLESCGVLSKYRAYPFIRLDPSLDTSKLPKEHISKVKKSILRGACPSRGGWHGFLYKLLTEEDVLDVPYVICVTRRSRWRQGNSFILLVSAQYDNREERIKIVKDFQRHVMAQEVLFKDGHFATGFNFNSSIYGHLTLYNHKLPEDVNYAKIAPLVKRFIYEPMGLTQEVLKEKFEKLGI